MNKTCKKIAYGILATVLLVAAGFGIWKLYPFVQSFAQPEKMAWLRDWLQSFGWQGVLLLFGVQTVQVLTGVVPALPIQLAAGLSYGVAGVAICLGGVALGSTIVFTLVKKHGQPLVNRAFPPEKQGKLAFLRDAKRLEPIVFILYLIPAMPKDVFTYLAGLTPLTLRRYLTLTLIARAPTIFCTVFASKSLVEGDYLRAAVIFCITALLGIVCMLFGGKIMERLERFAKK